MSLKYMLVAAALALPTMAAADHRDLQSLADQFTDATWQLSETIQECGSRSGSASTEAQELGTEAAQLVQLVSFGSSLYEIDRHVQRLEWRLRRLENAVWQDRELSSEHQVQWQLNNVRRLLDEVKWNCHEGPGPFPGPHPRP